MKGVRSIFLCGVLVYLRRASNVLQVTGPVVRSKSAEPAGYSYVCARGDMKWVMLWLLLNQVARMF